MDTLVVVVWLLAVVAVVMGGWLLWTAQRLHRLHRRCERSGAALATALAERRALSLEAARTSGVDPPTAVLLVDAASFDAADRQGPRHDSDWQRESELSEVLRAVWPGDDHDTTIPPWGALGASANRVGMARRIHNDLVATCIGLRSRRRVRWFRLTGHAAAPVMVAFDDEPP